MQYGELRQNAINERRRCLKQTKISNIVIFCIEKESFVTEYPMLQFKSIAVPNGGSIMLHFKPKN